MRAHNKMWCYQSLAMDIRWEMFSPVQVWLHDDEIFAAFIEAICLMTERKWEGDFTEGPCVFALPDANVAKVAFVWKQSNNGDTFVVSPVELPWLAEWLC